MLEMNISHVTWCDNHLYENIGVCTFSDGVVRIVKLREDCKVEGDEIISRESDDFIKALWFGFDLLIGADFNGNLVIWKNSGGNWDIVWEKKVVEKTIYDISIKKEDDFTYVYLGCADGILMSIKFDQNFEIEITEKKLHNLALIKVSCDSKHIVTCGLDGEVKFMNIKEEEILEGPKETVDDSKAILVSLAPTSIFDKTVYAVGYEDGTVLIHNYLGGDSKEYKSNKFDLGAPVDFFKWCEAGYCLLVIGKGRAKVKTFEITGDDYFREVEMLEAK